MKRYLYRFFTLLLAGSFLLAACSLGGASPADVSAQVTQTMQAVATDVAATLQAAAPKNTVVPANTLAPTNTTAPTETTAPTQPPAPTETPAPTVEATAAPTSEEAGEPTSTPISSPTGAVAHMTLNTNCRLGPSTDYGVVFVALEGTDLQIVSKTTFDSYVIVTDPKNSARTCWLWTQYADISGSLSNLPVATPPPTPTPEFNYTLAFYKIEECGGWDVGFKVVNTGSSTLQSYEVSVKDTVTHSSVGGSSDDFDKRSGCDVTKTITELDPGDTGFVFSNSFEHDPTGHALKATVTICSHDSQEGTCITQTLDFTP